MTVSKENSVSSQFEFMKNPTQFNTYFFVFAHPDDEVLCCSLIKRLVDLGKEVHMIYLTSGDAGGAADTREKELRRAMPIIGIRPDYLHLLRISELELFNRLNEILNILYQLAQKYSPDCVIGQTYEGGHEGHDISSFCSSALVQKMGINGFFVFPTYYGKPQERILCRFKPEQKEFVMIQLTEKEIILKKTVVGTHESQEDFFRKLHSANPDNSDSLFSREIYVEIDKPIDYHERPMAEIGYEYHRNGFKFNDFQRAIQKTPLGP